MSKFKRSFLSPHQLYKSLYASPLSDSASENKNERQQKAASQMSSLQLCRGSSVVCDNVEVPKENRHPNRRLQPSLTIQGVINSEECNISCNAGHENDGFLYVEERSLRQPLCSLSENVPAKPAITKQTNLAVPECKEADAQDEKALLFGPVTPLFAPPTTPLFAPPTPLFTPPIPLFAPPTPNRPLHVWDDDPNCDAAPGSSWSALGNRYLLCRPLPLDVGRCACYILHEREAGADSPIVYSLYTDEGHGRQDRKLAVARHRRRSGRSEFIIGQNGADTLLAKREEGFMGRVSANIVGSRYHIWDEATTSVRKFQGARQLLGVIMFEPTVTTFTGTYRVMRAYVPKYQSLHISNTTQHESIGLAKDWEENMGKAHELCSRKPYYNREMRRYELDYRDRTRSGYRIQTSSKNFQLIMEEHGKQVILLHGKVGNSKYIMEYRFPLTAYQAFGICLASIDSKLCCSV
eukprot:c19356_g1_i1 orf=315-1709(-)